jgi:FkbM family methyltransferase
MAKFVEGIMVPETEEGPFSKSNILEWGEKDYIEAKKHIRSYRVCADVGAHVGLTSLRYAKDFDIVHSFEPLVFDCLTYNTRECSNVIPHEYALSDKETMVTMYAATNNTGRGLVFDPEHEYHRRRMKHYEKGYYLSHVKPSQHQAIPLDNLNLENVDFIKIDVEGYNRQVLSGMTNTLDNNDPVIQIEDCNDTKQSKFMEQFFSDRGYKLVKILKNSPRDYIYSR